MSYNILPILWHLGTSNIGSPVATLSKWLPLNIKKRLIELYVSKM
uniref:Uncharacterized protein n=1 Tax=Rhizophora mucronata TaxID=61149 RepID=A0A2P2PLU4_RHIMU